MKTMERSLNDSIEKDAYSYDNSTPTKRACKEKNSFMHNKKRMCINYEELYLEKCYELSSLESKVAGLEEDISRLELECTQAKSKVTNIERKSQLQESAFQQKLQEALEEKNKIFKKAEHNFNILKNIKMSMGTFDITQITKNCNIMLDDISLVKDYVVNQKDNPSSLVVRKNEKLMNSNKYSVSSTSLSNPTKKTVQFSKNTRKPMQKTEQNRLKKKTFKKSLAARSIIDISDSNNEDGTEEKNKMNTQYNYTGYPEYGIDKFNHIQLHDAAKESFNELVRKALELIIGNNMLMYCTAAGKAKGLNRPPIPSCLKIDIRRMYTDFGYKEKLMNNVNNAANNYIVKLRRDAGLQGDITNEEELAVAKHLEVIEKKRNKFFEK